MKVTIFSWSVNSGGAARASYRLFTAIKKYESKEIAIKMRVNNSEIEEENIIGPRSNINKGWSLLRRYIGLKFQNLQKTSNQVYHSSSLIPSLYDQEINKSDTDLINLHWVQGEMLSIKAIGRIKKPIIFTLHDCWAFSGSEHYPNGYNDNRYKNGYFKWNVPKDHRGIDIDRICWNMKRKCWKLPHQIVCPSNWLANKAKESLLMKDWPITVIPNPVPLEIYKPLPKEFARKVFNLNLEKDLILFGALNGSKDNRKGWDLLEPALNKLSDFNDNIEAIVIGETTPLNPPKLGMKIKYLGELKDDQSLSLIYSAVDVMVVPSRMENLPQTATEAQSCGTPVVAFNCSGFPDTISHKETGYLAAPFDSESLKDGIIWVLEKNKNGGRISLKARERALKLWDEKIIAEKYKNLYEKTNYKYNKNNN